MSVEVEGSQEVAASEPKFETTFRMETSGSKHFDRKRFVDALTKALDRQIAGAAMQMMGNYVKPGEFDENMERYGNRRFHVECFGKNGNVDEHLPRPYTTHDTIAKIAREVWHDAGLSEESYLPTELEGPLADELLDGHQGAIEVRIVLSVASE